jgi:desulfoferrodoxin-like iron-binding protein
VAEGVRAVRPAWAIAVGMRNRRRKTMGVKSVGEKYRCEVCGNEVEVTKVGGGALVCCGMPMVLQG